MLDAIGAGSVLPHADAITALPFVCPLLAFETLIKNEDDHIVCVNAKIKELSVDFIFGIPER